MMVGGVPAIGTQVWGNARPSCGSSWTQHVVCGHQAYTRLGGLFSDLGSSRRSRRSFTVARPSLENDSTPEAPASGEAPVVAAAGGLAVAERTDIGRVLDVELRSEVEKSYLSYAMSVIVGRALPDVRDGLKPVHRRILFAMYDLGLMPHKPFRKSARVVGEVLGKYHPHGDTAVYDALVRLAQPFSMRMPLINGHGNFGSQDNDPAAAMRYTECRLQKASMASLLEDIEQDTVAFHETFDGSEREPTVLPARLPNLLINGSQGIAVGMATNIPPHNMKEVVAALEALILNPDITVAELMTHLPGPDFPTGGEILASQSLEEAYSTGRGPITVRGRALIEQEGADGKKKKGSGPPRSVIVITELPFQTNKAALVEHIAELANEDKVLQGVSDVRDESDREGMRVVVELKKGVVPEVVLNNLYKHTQLQKRFSCNLVALVGGVPCRLGLKDMLAHFLSFRCQVVTRRANFELRRAERRLHIVAGLVSAQQQLDAVVETIRKASDVATACHMLRGLLDLSPEQADAVLALPLRRLTSMEASKLLQEERELQQRSSSLKKLLGSNKAIRQMVIDEAHELTNTLGDERRTLVRKDLDGVLQHEDIIPNRQSLIVFSSRGYIKRMAADFFSPQNRGGTGQKVASLRDDDSVEELMVVRDHQSLLFFTTDGHAFSIKAYEVPQASRTASGTALPQVVRMSKDQKVVAMLPVTDFAKDGYVMLLSRNGFIKRMTLEAFAKNRQGTNAMDLGEDDELIWVRKCQPEDDVMLALTDGCVQRYSARMFRPMGRAARGTRAVKLRPDVGIVGMTILPAQEEASSAENDNDALEGAEEEGYEIGEVDGPCILFVTDKGYGKRVPARLFRRFLTSRAKGVIGIKLNDDQLGAFHVVTNEKEVLLSTANGLITRIALDSVPTQSRTSKGVILMRPKTEQDKISTVTLLDADEEAA